LSMAACLMILRSGIFTSSMKNTVQILAVS